MIKYQRQLRNSVSHFHHEDSHMPFKSLRRVPNSFSKFIQACVNDNKRKIRITHKCSPISTNKIPSTSYRRAFQRTNMEHTFERLHNEYYDEYIPCTIYLRKKKKILPPPLTFKTKQRVSVVQSQNNKEIVAEKPASRDVLPALSTLVVSIFSKNVRLCDKSGSQFEQKVGEEEMKKINEPKIQYQIIGWNSGSGPTLFQQNRFSKQGMDKQNKTQNISSHHNFLSNIPALNTTILKLQSQISHHSIPKQINSLEIPQHSNKILLLINQVYRNHPNPFKLSISAQELIQKIENKPALDEYQLQYHILDKYAKQKEQFDVKDSEHMILIMQAHLEVLNLLNQYSQKLGQFEKQGSGELQSLILGVFKKFLMGNKDVIAFLEGKKDRNPFCLSSLTIPSQQIMKYVESSEFKNFLKNKKEQMRKLQEGNLEQFEISREESIMIQQAESCSYKFEENLKGELYNFLVIIEECLETNMISAQQQHWLQQLMIETVQVFCIITELDGRKVRKVILPEQVINFEEYYEKSIQIIDQIIN